MSPRRALLFSFLLAVLLPYYYFIDRPALKVAVLRTAQENLLKLKTVDAVTITSGAERIRFEKSADGNHYSLVEPRGKFVPEDLMQALAALLVSAKSVEVVAAEPVGLAEFGLDRPSSEIVVQSASDPKPIRISLGTDNPAHTAIYARIEGVPKVFLLGKNLEYYQTLMLQWVEGKQGKHT